MKNSTESINYRNISDEGSIDGGGIGLILFVATAIWLLLYHSNLFR